MYTKEIIAEAMKRAEAQDKSLRATIVTRTASATEGAVTDLGDAFLVVSLDNDDEVIVPFESVDYVAIRQ